MIMISLTEPWLDTDKVKNALAIVWLIDKIIKSEQNPQMAMVPLIESRLNLFWNVKDTIVISISVKIW